MTRYRLRDHIGTPLTSHATKVLLLGSGELGKEIAIEAHKLGVEVVAVDRYDNAPAMHLTHRKYVVNMLDGKAIKEIVRREMPDAVIPEVESIDVEALKELESEGFLIIPNAEAVKICMNRVTLRKLIAETLGLPTTKYFIAGDYSEVIKGCELVGYPCIIKPEMSSSGHGHMVIKEPLSDDGFYKAYEYAIRSGRGLSSKVLVEEYVGLEAEFTLLTYRYLNSDNVLVTKVLEPIEHWRYGYFHYVESWQPSSKPLEILNACKEYALKIVERLGGLGIYGVELFLTKDGRVLVSEVAPRPHDTGFVTLVTQDLSEFAIHLRASLRLPLPNVNLISAGASYAVYTELENVWGPEYYGLSKMFEVDGVDVRIFGKPYTYPGRRMMVLLSRGIDVGGARAKLRKAVNKVYIF